MEDFVHLHVHSYYSILDGQSSIKKLVDKAIGNGMRGMALTDHGDMFGVKELFDYCNKVNGGRKKEGLEPFKPIFGCEMYVAHRKKEQREADKGDKSGYHLIVLAKNYNGYKNLIKLVSRSWVDGFYMRPRTDRDDLERFHEDLIVCSACIAGEVPAKIIRDDIAGAREAIEWYQRVFGDDYYLELQRHEVKDPSIRANRETFPLQQKANRVLIELAREYGIKLVCTNDAHFVDEENAEAHDHLLCLSTGKDLDDPSRLLYTKQEWFKTKEEMNQIFADVPEALSNTLEILDKVEFYDIEHAPIMPFFPIPESFGTEEEWRRKITPEQLFKEFTCDENGENQLPQAEGEEKIRKLGGLDKLYRIKFEADYLAKLAYDGAYRIYGKPLSEEVEDRIRFELHIMKTMGFPGYFLIVQDFINSARDSLGVMVGPGRGSAAGSVVAYCLGITKIDPLKYDLLFERFLNPDRISLPDIDVDFDDEGRGRVLDWITQKYGQEKVAHIITYGTMATKSSLSDVCRVQNVPLSIANELKGYIPDKSDKFPSSAKDANGKMPPVNLYNCMKYLPEFQHIMESTAPIDQQLKEVRTYASELEDTNRQIGIHACGVIIGADDLTKFAPVCTIPDKESGKDVLVTQYDGHVIEEVGLIKMDFLGLKNLSIIKDALRNIKHSHHEDVDIDHIPLDDDLTFNLFSEGATIGTFQFESAGMQKYLRQLKPHAFEELIAMNALYRPGPLDYIPDFIERKHGRKPIEYDIPCMEKYLKDTYGITVYQEQVMLLSRQLANFTRGQSDTLRKAMGKKQIEKMNELEVLFYKGGEANGHDHAKLKKIWEDWKKFASYAFNKSHATCYAWVAYQTGYLKAHYPADYMAAVLTSSLEDIKRTTELLEECKRMKLRVLLPSINKSENDFSVDTEGNIRFGLSAIKGMGQAASDAIIAEREKGGPFTSIFNFLERVDLRTVKRNNVEALVLSGALDEFGDIHRAQYFVRDSPSDSSPTFLEKLLRWASRQQDAKEQSQMTIFDMGDSQIDRSEAYPQPPQVPEWTNLERCRNEREVIGFYLSGHPLDDFAVEMQSLVNTTLDAFANIEKLKGKHVSFAGIVTEARQGVSNKDGKPFGFITLEDYDSSYEIALFGEEFQKYKSYFQKDLFIFCDGNVETPVYRDKETGEKRDGKTRLRISKMQLLNEVMNNKAKSITLYVNLPDVTHEFCDKIKQIIEKSPRDKPIDIVVEAPTEKLSVTLSCTASRVDIRSIVKAVPQIPQMRKYKISYN